MLSFLSVSAKYLLKLLMTDIQLILSTLYFNIDYDGYELHVKP